MKRTISLMLALMLIVGLVACGGSGTTSQTPTGSSSAGMTDIKDVETDKTVDETKTYKKDIKVALIGGLTVFNPQARMDNVHDTCYKMVYNQLVQLNSETSAVEGELAESWEVESSSSYLFKLRKDIKFSNGEPFTADDVVFTFTELPFLTNEYNNATAVINEIEKVTAVDENTVRFELNKPDADFLNRMYLQPYSIYNREACEKDLAAGIRIGTNGWIVTDFVAGDHISYKRFDESWVWEDGGMNPTETITFSVRPESSSRAIAVQTGEVAAAHQLTLADVGTLASDPNVETMTFASENVEYFCFNLTDGVFADDENLRYAAAYAMDFDACNLLKHEGKAERAYTLWAKNQYGYYDGFEKLEHDLDKAKEYMAKSKTPNGCDVKMVFHNGANANVAALIQEQLKKIGINANIIETDTAGMTALVNGGPGQYDCVVSGISTQTIGDRYNFIGIVKSTNRAKYINEDMQALFKKALGESDDTARKAIYQEIQETLNKDKPYLPMYYGVESVAWNKKVTGIQWSPDTKPDYSHIKWEE